MDISGISTLAAATELLAPSAKPANSASPERNSAVNEPRGEIAGRRGRALGIFRAQLRISLQARFFTQFSANLPNYARLQQPDNADGVAAEALGAAKQVVAESPTTAAKSLVRFRSDVRETASFVRQIVEADDDIDEVDDAVNKIDDGIDELDVDIARNRESSASVLEVDTRLKQRSTIRIRTQEGDIVKLDLKRIDSLSARDAMVSNEDGFVTSTEVALSSRSRMMMRVKGDLNESELAAIQGVFAQAEEIANQFFGGDIGAAFNVVQGFEFDTEQLARVNMRFRMREVSNVSYVERTTAQPAPLPQQPVVDAGLEPVPGPVIQPIGEPIVRSPKDPVFKQPVMPVTEAPLDDAPVAEAPVSDAAAIDTTSIATFFDLLSGFLRSIGDGFEVDGGKSGFRFHYSESFKLELLKSVIFAVAPEESATAALNAGSVIDAISSEPAAEA